ncbi:bifunctional DNA-formamidopyrimidine glycosylase/DNA-(apurinic or apyrimidinic site) lyase [Candidatus Saccharibacteria bacterium]|nr:bifunctional DNA-formamidopyrimidine glycosylase/DNA-(apurinic or apyrimidinic site) lyase [Candidatus Saccharibacteria bacterium]
MPELPEVETIRRGLSQFIVKKKLTGTEILCDKSFQGGPVAGIVNRVRRFGKALIIDLDNQKSLMIHLRMTGQLIYDGEGRERYAAGHPSDNFVAALPNKQTRVILHFDAGTLYFNDQRKFGFIKVLPTAEVEHDPFIKKLAPEPWDMSADNLYAKLQRHKHSCIKPTILDQTIICGLGNIYADESLFQARIHPERKCGTITRTEVARLLAAAKDVMEKSITSGGSTMATYVKADGEKGDYLEKFAQVFHRDGKPCLVCGTTIIKFKVAGRGTHICPHCQRPPLSEAEASACDSSDKIPQKEPTNA